MHLSTLAEMIPWIPSRSCSDYAIITGQTQKFLGVPKTIDNDLALTDHTPRLRKRS